MVSMFASTTKDHPHAHVWKGDKNLRINLMTFEVSDNRGYNMREIGQIRKLVADNRELLFDVWKAIHERGS